MKLQVNLSGAWRDVCEFPPRELTLARFAGSMLACAAQNAKFAIIDDQGKRYHYRPGATAAMDDRWRTARGDELEVLA